MIEPRISHIPPRASSSGADAVELAAAAGIVLDDWQAFVLENSLGETADGSWSAFEVGVCLPRQNGKSEIAVARMLYGLIALDD
jgi:phage terminase large subunit-like protein